MVISECLLQIGRHVGLKDEARGTVYRGLKELFIFIFISVFNKY